MGLCSYDDLSSTADPLGWSRYITLDQALAGLQIADGVLLSFTLTSSLLQLHATPWLASFWVRQNICFRRIETASGLYSPDVDHPFVRCTFPATPDSMSPSCNVQRQLLELGILLLELWNQQSFEAYALSNGIVLGDTYGGRLDAAMKWLNQPKQRILPFFHGVVTRLLECRFATSIDTYSWDDGEFRSSICEHVVKPLWDINFAQ